MVSSFFFALLRLILLVVELTQKLIDSRRFLIPFDMLNVIVKKLLRFDDIGLLQRVFDILR